MIYKIFKYIEPIWLGTNKKVSIRRVLSLVFSFNLVLNISKTINNIKPGQTYSDVAILLGVEAGLIAALLSLTTYSTSLISKKDSLTNETD
jgi:hypothetical protein